jgi:hypothetical protein
MSESESPSIPDALSAIEAGSKTVNRAATELSGRIKLFEDWLNTLPGRVDTTVWVRDGQTEEGECFFLLRLHREGKRWVLSHGHYQQGMGPEDENWDRLTEASLETKLQAIEQFPALLRQIKKSQASLVERIEKANAVFDEFGRSIGVAKREGN